MKTYKIMEVFNSIQGEGGNAGLPMTFVRFAMCNLQCDFCDTSCRDGYTRIEHDKLLYDLKLRGPSWVCFTGGEPCIQLTPELILDLRDVGIKTALETNGTMWNDAIPNFDYITISPKPALKMIDPKVEEWLLARHPNNQKLEVRFIVTPTTKTIPELSILKAADYVCLSPMFFEDKMLDAAFENAMELINQYRGREFRLSVQIHKMLGVQ